MNNSVPSSSALWTTRTPSERASAPEWMSFHSFKDAERCPLSSSLRNSYYASIWDKKGYPNRPNASAVSGLIVHSCAEEIARRFVEAGISYLMEPTAMALLREVGGFTKMLLVGLDAYVRTQASNPRFVHCQEDLLRLVKLKIPDMRATLQELLASRDWSSAKPENGTEKDVSSKSASVKQLVRYALSVGTHIEIDLVDASMRWRGIPDVLVISTDGCQIIDFKTGSPDPEHQRQMLVYAMLWKQDSERNPNRIPIKKMTLIYRNGPVDVPIPNDVELAAFRQVLAEDTRNLKRKLESSEVPANPSVESCRYCQVKLLCKPYWKNLRDYEQGERLSNVEIILIEKRGDRGWLAQVKSHKHLTSGEQVILRRFESGNVFWPDLRLGLSLRVTDVIQSLHGSDEIPILSLTMLSEALFVD